MKKDVVKCPGCGGSALCPITPTLRVTPLRDGASLVGDLESYACTDCRLISFFISALDVAPLKRAQASAKPAARPRTSSGR